MSSVLASLICFGLVGYSVCLAGFILLWRWTVSFEEKVAALTAGLETLQTQAAQNTRDVAELQAHVKAQDKVQDEVVAELADVKRRADDFDAKLNLLVDKLTAVLGAEPVEPAALPPARRTHRARAAHNR